MATKAFIRKYLTFENIKTIFKGTVNLIKEKKMCASCNPYFTVSHYSP